ncbi:hypothetical protein, partial [Moorena sp. SIO4G3]|uniref:hypothetical protein n=1 Tax=Moorena sp. SIO4G3 TaxID=2607821 RepID=UPI0025E355F6
WWAITVNLTIRSGILSICPPYYSLLAGIYVVGWAITVNLTISSRILSICPPYLGSSFLSSGVVQLSRCDRSGRVGKYCASHH